jgi:hypothetical protein
VLSRYDRSVNRFFGFLRVVRVGVALTALCYAAPASANGRFPESNHFFFSDKDPNLVLERTTFGVLVSHDKGKTFQWVCEPAMGLTGSEDTMLAIGPSGAIVGTTFQGLTRSQDQACSWALVPETGNQVFIDLTQNPNDETNIIAFASNFKGVDAGVTTFTSQLWESKDEGKTFAKLGQPLDDLVLTYTVDVTKTDPNRIYVTGTRKTNPTPTGGLFVSPDHGTSWVEITVPLVDAERSLWIAAVDPTNANRVYLRTSNASNTGPDRLILVELEADAGVDAGAATQRLIFTATGALRGFALNADGTKAYVGGPKDGVKVASTSDFAWQTRANIQVQCLAVTADGLWACSNEQTGFIAGLSKDDGATFQPLIHFCDIQGPLTCGPTTGVTNQCTSIWPGQRQALGCIDDGGAGGTDDGGPGSSSGDATPLSSSGSKCSADVRGASMTSALPWGALVPGALVAAGAFVRRRRRRRR